MTGSELTFYVLAANPVGGLLVAVPYGVLKLGYPVWQVVALAVPLAYLQVVAIDLGWGVLNRWPAFGAFLSRRRSARIDALLQSRGNFWLTFLATPLLGAWAVMAFMRYGQVPQRRVALPIVAALTTLSAVIAELSICVPALFDAAH